MIYLLLLFLAVGLLLYVLFGGADYGAGVVELFKGKYKTKEQQNLINRSMGPVWEANHVWLILAVVILFMGFPPAYTTILTYFYIPIIAILVGIVIRGCAFTFRSYDAVKDERSQKIYSALFIFSSIWTPFWYGVILSSLLSGGIQTGHAGFYEVFVASWLTPSAFAFGGFVILLFTFLGSTYLIGESRDPELQNIFQKRALFSLAGLILFGAIVLFTGKIGVNSMASVFFRTPISMGALVVATILLVPLYLGLKKGKILISRILTAGIVSMILIGWFDLSYPTLYFIEDGKTLKPVTFFDIVAPPETQFQLLLALGVGILIILPTFIYLLYVFQRSEK